MNLKIGVHEFSYSDGKGENAQKFAPTKFGLLLSLMISSTFKYVNSHTVRGKVKMHVKIETSRPFKNL